MGPIAYFNSILSVSTFTDEYMEINDLKNGVRIEIYWPLEVSFYRGTINAINNGLHRVQYDDGDVESLRLINEN